MKRDDDFIKKLLIEAEDSDDSMLLAFDGINTDEEDLKRITHAKWLCDERFFQEVSIGVFRMTNQGNDYLAAIRDDGVWKKTKETAAGMGGVGLGVMRDIAIAYVKQEITTRFGLSL